VTTPTYRARIRRNDDKLYLTDFRYFDKNLTDPYNNYVAKKNGYWIAPYSLDYSHVYKSDSIFPETRNDLSVIPTSPYVIPTEVEESSKLNAKQFNQTLLKNYPYFLPEPIEREIDPKKTQLKITVDKKIVLELKVKDRYGYPDVISPPLDITTDNEQVETINEKIDGEKHIYSFLTPPTPFLKIVISSNKKTIKTIYLFPKLLPFLKLVL